MAKLKSPSITLSFIEKAASAITRGDRGVVGLVLTDIAQRTFTVTGVSDIPLDLSDENQQLILDALKGYTQAPLRVKVFVMAKADDMASAYADAERYFATEQVDYVAFTSAVTDTKAEALATWVKGLRDNYHSKIKLVVPYAADCEGVIDWESTLTRTTTSTDSKTGKVTVTRTSVVPEKGCARIAGLRAGTGLTLSATYAKLTDFADVDRLDPDALDTAVGAGKLVAFWDDDAVKLNRAVNSLQTTTDVKGDSFKKIKIVEDMDLMQYDIRKTIKDDYIGKYVNSYDNKLLLVTAINAYFKGMVDSGVLSAGTCEIDVDAQKDYLKGLGKPVVIPQANGMAETKDIDKCTDMDIKKANTGSHVFLRATVSILDAIEDVTLPISI